MLIDRPISLQNDGSGCYLNIPEKSIFENKKEITKNIKCPIYFWIDKNKLS